MTLKNFTVTEIVEYSVQAETPKDACLIIINADDRDTHFKAVSDRYAVSEDGTETGSEDDEDTEEDS